MKNLCTIIYQPEEIIEGSTFDKLITRFPQAAFHDKKNRLFNGIDEGAENPILVSELLPNFTQEIDEDTLEPVGLSYIDTLVQALAPLLFADDRTRPLHIKKSVLSQLYRHPAYRLYCGNYETVEELNIDHLLIFGVDADDSKSLEELNAESRVKLEQVF